MPRLSLQVRAMIQALVSQGLSDPAIALQLSISAFTVRKWRRRGKQAASITAVPVMGRPTRGALSSFPAGLVEMLSRWRDAHPGWGPKTLLAELRRSDRFCDQPVPSSSSIARWLRQTQRAKPYHKHSALPVQVLSSAASCHAEWEMDARGHEKAGEAGVIALINLNDVFSRVKLLSFPCYLGQQRASHHPTTQDYQTALRLAFSRWGRPEQLSVDHESVYCDNLSASPFPTRFHLWLLSLGVRLAFGRMGQPKDQAVTERSHQLWYHQVLEGQPFGSYLELFRALQDRLTFLNEHLPCASLHEQPPLVAHPEACIPRHPYRPEYEAQLIDLARVYAFLSEGQWFRKASNIGAISLGKQVYCLGAAWARSEVEITFDPAQTCLICRSGEGREVRKPLQGVSAQDLMGDSQLVTALPNFQLALPFTWQDQLHACWPELLTGTTF